MYIPSGPYKLLRVVGILFRDAHDFLIKKDIPIKCLYCLIPISITFFFALFQFL